MTYLVAVGTLQMLIFPGCRLSRAVLKIVRGITTPRKTARGGRAASIRDSKDLRATNRDCVLVTEVVPVFLDGHKNRRDTLRISCRVVEPTTGYHDRVVVLCREGRLETLLHLAVGERVKATNVPHQTREVINGLDRVTVRGETKSLKPVLKLAIPLIGIDGTYFTLKREISRTTVLRLLEGENNVVSDASSGQVECVPKALKVLRVKKIIA